jgi:hypothetical protein
VPEPGFIVGRSSELELLDRFLLGEETVLNLFGPGGMGKTVVTRLWEERARQQGVIVASRDVAGGVSPDILLQDLRDQFAGYEAAGADSAFAEFDRRLREHLILSQVLQASGGAGSFFTALGQVKDPSGLAAALGALGRAVSDQVARRLSNHATFERYWRGADSILAEAFWAGLAGLVGRSAGVLVLLDTHEDAGGLDDWMCRTLVPTLASAGRLCLSGRNELARMSFDWADLDDQVVRCPLGELEPDEARSYLNHYGLYDPRSVQRVLDVTGGYPLLLMLVRQLARSGRGWEVVTGLELGDRDEIARQLLERILREEPVRQLRDLLELGSVPPWLDPGVVGAVLDCEPGEGRRLYDLLARHSFAERHPRGLRIHDKIRDLLRDRLRFTDPSRYAEVTSRLDAHFGGREQRAREEAGGAD